MGNTGPGIHSSLVVSLQKTDKAMLGKQIIDGQLTETLVLARQITMIFVWALQQYT